MKKTILKSVSATVLLGILMASCKSSHSSIGNNKSNTATMITLTTADTHKDITAKKGQKIQIMLRNPGDGGYQFDEVTIDRSLLFLDSHTHAAPPNNGMVGNFGTDTWIFSTVATGKTSIKITASRSWEKDKTPSEIFAADINIQ